MGGVLSVIPSTDLGKDINIIRLAREIAIDHYPVSDIKTKWNIDDATWDAIQEWPRFQELVDRERQAWFAASNTQSRIRLKSAIVIEEWLEEGYRLLHAASETFSNKVELLKLLGKFSSLDQPTSVQGEIAGGRVSINIHINETNVSLDGTGSPYEDDMIEGQLVQQAEQDPDTIDFDWEEEFPINPVEGADAIFEDVNAA